ncbi:hypothetical protein [Saccharothrix xinjiangensis]|uniref:Uncharacterized protein n=1 Tax=Saccharothrix xinjiangensis TaxID=204798 RepID=A0ABV9XVX5_9PSEU
MDHNPDPADRPVEEPTRFIDSVPVDSTQLVEQPPTGSRVRVALIGVVTALGLGVAGVTAYAVTQATGTPAAETPAAVIQTGTSTAGAVVEAAELTTSTSMPTTDPVTTLTAAPPPAEQPVQQPPAPAPVPTELGNPVETGAPTIPPGHVDSCAYPNMAPTTVSGTVYSPAPTPTITAVTSPDRCPPYSAGYPWDGA